MLSIVFRVGVCASLFPTNFKLSFITEFMFTKLERKFTSIQRNCNDAMTQANEKSATIDRSE
jgi:hypothetical protein